MRRKWPLTTGRRGCHGTISNFTEWTVHPHDHQVKERRPGSAKGVMFVTIEHETGGANPANPAVAL